LRETLSLSLFHGRVGQPYRRTLCAHKSNNYKLVGEALSINTGKKKSECERETGRELGRSKKKRPKKKKSWGTLSFSLQQINFGHRALEVNLWAH